MNTNDMRGKMLEVIAKLEDGSHLQSGVVLERVATQIGARTIDDERAILTCWHDLLRTGILAWGHSLGNPNPPFAHLTEQGRRGLRNLSRDPSNPDGYVAALSAVVPSGTV